MIMSNNSSSRCLPQTSNQLNYYLSLCKKGKETNHQQNQNQRPNSRSTNFQKIQQSMMNENKYQKQKYLSVPQTNQYSIYHNPYQFNNNTYTNNQLSNVSNLCYDSLDLLTDRTNKKQLYIPNMKNDTKLDRYKQNNLHLNKSQFIDNQNFCKNNYEIPQYQFQQTTSRRIIGNLSNKKQNYDYQDYQDYEPITNQRQPSLKKVKWNTSPSKSQQQILKLSKQVYQNNFKDISRQLCKLNYQIKSNSNKLEQMSTIYAQKKKKKINPNQCIKRANMKFAIDKINNGNNIQFRKRPKIQYQDKIYMDPTYLIWQPLR